MSEKVIERIRGGLGEKAGDVKVKNPRRVYMDVAAANLVQVAKCLWGDLGARYAIASGMEVESGFEVLHHFAFDADHVVVSVRVKTGRDNPEVPSIANVIKGAEYIEREMHDLLGIKFTGHPNLARLILPDDWPADVYPLRRGKPWVGKVRKQV